MPLKIAIVGMGVAGSYLAARLLGVHDLTCFERSSRENFDAVCAWGTCKQYISTLVRKVGLDFDDYVLHEGKEMLVDVGGEPAKIELVGLCTYDKLRLIKDMVKGVEVHYGVNVNHVPPQGDYDLIVDATGMPRPLLPRIEDDVFIPCVQYKVRYKDPPFDDFYIKPAPNLSGYLWYFPLGNGYAHVGAGDYYKTHNAALDRLLKQYPCEILKKTGRPIRLTPPSKCQPFYRGNVVGVGESIGTVYPLVGEGIIPSMQCADLLVEHLSDLNAYRTEVLKNFQLYDTVYNVIMAALNGHFSIKGHLLDLLKIFFHMRSHEQRYGLRIRLWDMLKVARSYQTASTP